MLEQIKSQIRDLKINSVISPRKNDISICDTIKLSIFKKNNIIRYASYIGAVLTGSRALKCYYINNLPILNRQVNDWDFLVTREMIYNICDKFNIQYDLVAKVLTVQSHFVKWEDSYNHETRIGKQDIQFIIVDELPQSIKIRNFRITEFVYILEQKLLLINFNIYQNSGSKHLDDLNKIVIRLQNNSKN